jgi:hypothetical protein
MARPPSPQFNSPGVFKVTRLGTILKTTTQGAFGTNVSLGYTPGRGLQSPPQSQSGSGIPYVPGPGMLLNQNELSINAGAGLTFNAAGALVANLGTGLGFSAAGAINVTNPLPATSTGNNGFILQTLGGLPVWAQVFCGATGVGGALATTFQISWSTFSALATGSHTTTYTNSFTSVNTYLPFVFRLTNVAPIAVTPTAVAANSVTYPVTITDTYGVLAIGT